MNKDPELKEFSEILKQKYLDYAVSVISERALPDLYDGLKPVQRRILYSLYLQGQTNSKNFKTSARTVGDVLGKYHPHGETSIYQALVKMSQNFISSLPLVQGQGNFGSIDGDNAASMRYTQVKLAKVSNEFFKFLETTPFQENFDLTLKEPIYFRTLYPQLLLSKISGIAVGMSTEILPFNSTEIFSAMIAVLKGEVASVEELHKFILGPDFATRGIIRSEKEELSKIFETGSGKISIYPEYEIKTEKDETSLLLLSLPPNTNKSEVLSEIAEVLSKKNLKYLSSIFDDSDKNKIKIKISVKKQYAPFLQTILKLLCKKTNIAKKLSFSNVFLVEGRPVKLGTLETIQKLVAHALKVLTEHFEQEKEKLNKKLHFSSGLLVVYEELDKIIAYIKTQPTTEELKLFLKQTFSLDEIQIKAILEMKLQKFTKQEKEKVIQERENQKKELDSFEAYLRDEDKKKKYLQNEYALLLETYGEKRRTKLKYNSEEEFLKEVIFEEEMVVLQLLDDRLLRLAPEVIKAQNLGGKGNLKNVFDYKLKYALSCKTTDKLIFFCTNGIMYSLQAHKLILSSRGEFLSNYVSFKEHTEISCYFSIKPKQKGFIILVYSQGLLKVSKLEQFYTISKIGKRYYPKGEKINLISTFIVSSMDTEIFLATKGKKVIRFELKEVRLTGRITKGVKGITLEKGDQIIDAGECSPEGFLLTSFEDGTGRIVPMNKYRKIKRGGKGVLNGAFSKEIASVTFFEAKDLDTKDFLAITEKGYSLKSQIDKIRLVGSRSSKGIILIRLNPEDKLKRITLL